ncbi:MAG: nickel-dependent hydrogenase large subunit, partial [Planctomycetaceae bacterium]|nr:nickel-dependent hydrogenase large subunit [Planctomycetaceae bacterium]
MAEQRTIKVDYMARVEGEGALDVLIEDQEVKDVKLRIFEPPRFFEAFLRGREAMEAPDITARICGICPVSHHLAAAKASDALTGQTPPRPASLLRELMHMGQVIQSHGMHFFELAGPDLLLGFDAAPEMRNVVGLIGANPELTVKAVQLRKFGQEIIKTLGGRKIHPVFAVPGGVNKALTVEERDNILKGVDAAVDTLKIGLQIMKDWAAKNMEDINKFAVFPTGYFGLTTPENGLELYDGDIRLISREGKPLE